MLEKYHARSLVVYFLVWFLLALFYNSLFQLILMLLATLFLNYRLDRLYSLRKVFAFILPIAILIVIINSLFNQNGQFLVANFNLWGYTVSIYKETIYYGIAMAVKLILILSIFSAFNFLIPVERILDIFGRYSGTPILLVAISARMVPDMLARLRSIKQVQRSRGMVPPKGGLIKRSRNLGPLLFNLLQASLQGALQMAEAMQARGYGSSKQRSRFCQEKWQGADGLLLTLALIVLGLVLAGWFTGTGYQNYSPLQQALLPPRWVEVLLLVFLSLPFLGTREIIGERYKA
jgi:energy-coupling factor transport system permease protein